MKTGAVQRFVDTDQSLTQYVIEHEPQTIRDVHKLMDEYFGDRVWSISAVELRDASDAIQKAILRAMTCQALLNQAV